MSSQMPRIGFYFIAALLQVFVALQLVSMTVGDHCVVSNNFAIDSFAFDKLQNLSIACEPAMVPDADYKLVFTTSEGISTTLCAVDHLGTCSLSLAELLMAGEDGSLSIQSNGNNSELYEVRWKQEPEPTSDSLSLSKRDQCMDTGKTQWIITAGRYVDVISQVTQTSNVWRPTVPCTGSFASNQWPWLQVLRYGPKEVAADKGSMQTPGISDAFNYWAKNNMIGYWSFCCWTDIQKCPPLPFYSLYIYCGFK